MPRSSLLTLSSFLLGALVAILGCGGGESTDAQPAADSSADSTGGDSIADSSRTEVADTSDSTTETAADTAPDSADVSDVSETIVVPPGSTVFARKGGGSGDHRGRVIASDAAGNVGVGGYFSGTLDLGGGVLTSAGGTDAFLGKLDASGKHLWSKRYGDGSNQSITAVGIDGAGNIYIAGAVAGTIDFGGGTLTSVGGFDMFAAKLDSDGKHVWSKRYGDADEQGIEPSAVDAAGNFWITGFAAGTIDFGCGAHVGTSGAMIVAKLDNTGKCIFSHVAGDTQAIGFSVGLDATGNGYVTGRFPTSIDFGGGTLTSAGDADIFLVKYDGTGKHLWSKRFGGTGEDEGGSVVVDKTGNVILVGEAKSSLDFGGGALTNAGGWDGFATKLDSTGAHVWSKIYGDGADQFVSCASLDATGNVYLSGSFGGKIDFGGGALTTAGDTDLVFAKLTAAGAHVWSKRFGDAESQVANHISVDGLGAANATGWIKGTVDFGAGPLVTAGGYNVFVLKLAP